MILKILNGINFVFVFSQILSSSVYFFFSIDRHKTQFTNIFLRKKKSFSQKFTKYTNKINYNSEFHSCKFDRYLLKKRKSIEMTFFLFMKLNQTQFNYIISEVFSFALFSIYNYRNMGISHLGKILIELISVYGYIRFLFAENHFILSCSSMRSFTIFSANFQPNQFSS